MTLVKVKDKKNPPPGIKDAPAVKNHQEKLTKHGIKPIIAKEEESHDKHVPHVPHVTAVEVPATTGRKKRKDPPPSDTGLLKPGRPTKRARRVSAHEI